ncbi:MAG: tRNA (adenosine(37)-N6)-threonylcarbamoyltransferase complex transferase subunit TsaD [Nitrospiraceae bacterium]|nr:tRNA (adenosine(37)-N6)-threonylcarbamoyltransferase complex transferase subunit TsaD [Nitrospiraceae bacterium]
MLILGIDTSCDDTSAALLDVEGPAVNVVSNVISSQFEIHKKYGGIVPELASRRHLEMIWPVVREALGGTGIEGLSAIAVCKGPGLIGSLLVGASFGKSVCFSKGIPLVGVNHLEGHILSAFLEGAGPGFPFLSLIVSGGHTSLYMVEGFRKKFRELGRSRDDAAGEAYDKVAKLLGLGYPGGPKIDALSREGDPKSIRFPRAYLPGTYDFSFSGLKTAVVNFLRDHPGPADERNRDVAASFQAAVIDVLVRKCEWAIRETGVRRLSVSGGVASNSALKERMRGMAEKRGVELFIPSPVFCTDNAAMIAFAGYHHLLASETEGPDLNPRAYLPL